MIKTLLELITSGNLYELKDFIEKNNIDINAPIDKDDNSLLHITTRELKLEMVRFLIDKCADVNCRNQNQQTPLMLAIYKGHLEIVKLLIDNGADITKADITKLDTMILRNILKDLALEKAVK